MELTDYLRGYAAGRDELEAENWASADTDDDYMRGYTAGSADTERYHHAVNRESVRVLESVDFWAQLRTRDGVS